MWLVGVGGIYGCGYCRGGVEGPAGTANAVPLFTVVRIAVPLFKAGRTGVTGNSVARKFCRADRHASACAV